MKNKQVEKLLKISLELLLIYIILNVGIKISDIVKPIIFIPGSIFGMIILLCLLIFKIIKVNYVETSGKFLLKNMGFFFIPLGVGLIDSVDLLKEVWLDLLLIIIISGSLVMYISSKVTDLVIKFTNKTKKDGAI